MTHCLARIAAATALLVACSLALAQFPTKPVTIVVPFPAGTASDTLTRIVATEMSATMGQPIVVQNRPGANSAIGAAAVAAAAPDGHTLLLATAGTVALPAMSKSLPYDTLGDFAPISMLSRFALFLYVNSELPVKSLPELLDYARAHPGKLNLATGNPVGIAASAQMLALAGNLNMVMVPYKGEPAAILDLGSNRVQVMFSTPSSADSLVKAGKVRVLATNLPSRAQFAPEIPSINEYLPKFTVTAWAGLMAPKGVPKDVVDKLSREVIAAMNKPQTREKFERLQFMPSTSTPEEFDAFFREQLALYGRVLREAGVEPQ